MRDLWQAVSNTEPFVLHGIGIILAAFITSHILLTKANVTAAAGWIGFVWFEPFVGSLAYFVLGVNRVQRRARRMRRHPSATGGQSSPEDGIKTAPTSVDGGFEALIRAVGFITGRPLETGNAIAVLHNGDEAYPMMLAAIAAATTSVGMSTYIMRADQTGMRFVAALREAQARGVAVRVIVDGVGSGWIRSPAYDALVAAGIPTGRFMHSVIPWKMPFLNLRTHKKILVVDGCIGFTGGINIADQNVMSLHAENPVQDTHFHITGPVVGQLVEAFAQDWAFVTDERLQGDAWFPPDAAIPPGAVPARVMTAGPDQDLEKIEFAVLEALGCARDRIQIMTPYFLPDERLMSALSLAAIRGVAVDIVVPERGDHRLVDWALRANVATFLRNGGRVWRSPPPFRHSKVMVVDGCWCMIGSSNWDIRSFRLNFELCIEFYDGALADMLERLMAEYRDHPLLLGEIKTRPLWRRLRDAAARLMLPYL